MNVTPPLIFEDPNPLTSTAAFEMYVDPTPTPKKYEAPPCMDVNMWSRPVLVSRFSVTRDVGDSAQVFSSTVGPNEHCTPFQDQLMSWKDIPLTFFRHINWKEEIIIEAVCPDENKGRFAIHIYDYPTTRVYDTQQLRNRVEYWDLSESKRFSFILNPTANFHWKQRYTDGTQVDNRYNLVWNPPGDLSTRQTPFNSGFEVNDDPELNEYGRWEILMDQNLQIPVAYPDTVDFLVWKRIVDLELYNAKGVVEGIREFFAEYE
jgi:hypothetical protein